MSRLYKYLLEAQSDKGDKYEREIAQAITDYGKERGIDLSAERPVASTKYSDVKMKYNGAVSWLEVKINHNDRLSNPQMFYTKGKWHQALTSASPTAKHIASLLNGSSEAAKWIDDLSKFSGIPKDKMILSSNTPPKNEPNYVNKDTIKAFIKAHRSNQTIMMLKGVDLTKIVTDHYTTGKSEPAHYIQMKDDFFMLGSDNPLKFNNSVPKFSTKGYIEVRFVPRESKNMCNFQTIIKSTDKTSSGFSFMKGTKKKLPID